MRVRALQFYVRLLYKPTQVCTFFKKCSPPDEYLSVHPEHGQPIYLNDLLDKLRNSLTKILLVNSSETGS